GQTLRLSSSCREASVRATTRASKLCGPVSAPAGASGAGGATQKTRQGPGLRAAWVRAATQAVPTIPAPTTMISALWWPFAALRSDMLTKIPLRTGAIARYQLHGVHPQQARHLAMKRLLERVCQLQRQQPHM